MGPRAQFMVVRHVCLLVVSIYCVVTIYLVVVGVVCDVVRLDVYIVAGGSVFVAPD